MGTPPAPLGAFRPAAIFLGVGAGIGMAELLSRTAGWAMRISPESVVLSFTFSIGVGLLFGILPARRAAKLDPIEALRYE